MNNFFIKFGSILGAISVVIGAFGAHLLKESLKTTGRSETFETAVRYQFYTAFALILVGILAEKFPNKWNNLSGYLHILGSIIFSGSLYIICFTGITAFGAVAPIGGLCMIAAWLFLFLSIKN